MGSKPRDSGTMQASTAGAQASDAALARQADANTQFSQAGRAKLFGSGSSSGDFSGGTLSPFLDPKSLDVSAPTGTYGLQYNQAVQNAARQAQNSRGAASDYLASRGFGDAPSGFQADQQRRADQAQSDTQGAAFTDLAGKSYQDALNNFWRANDALSGSSSNSMSAAIQGNTSAAGNYTNLYNTASTPVPSTAATLAGGALSAGGQIGAGALGGKKKP